jgi:DNA-directed RNA polymerase subunit RPC12/RpoP
MRCPECGSPTVESRGKRNVPYPLALVVILPLVFALLHQASSPVDYRCPNCGLRFAWRTSTARFALITMVLIIAALVILSGLLFLRSLV